MLHRELHTFDVALGGVGTDVFVEQSAKGAIAVLVHYKCNPEVPGSVSLDIAWDGSEKGRDVTPPSC